MSQLLTIRDKNFKPFISHEKIAEAVKRIAEQINKDLDKERPIFLAVLNGSFMFAADLLKEVHLSCEISFIKVASYQAEKSTGQVTELIGLKEDVNGRTVVIIEDIVDSGLTIKKIKEVLQSKNAKDVRVATVLFKPAAYLEKEKPEYIGFEIGNEFVVGYGLDYNGEGRNQKSIYVIA